MRTATSTTQAPCAVSASASFPKKKKIERAHRRTQSTAFRAHGSQNPRDADARWQLQRHKRRGSGGAGKSVQLYASIDGSNSVDVFGAMTLLADSFMEPLDPAKIAAVKAEGNTTGEGVAQEYGSRVISIRGATICTPNSDQVQRVSGERREGCGTIRCWR